MDKENILDLLGYNYWANEIILNATSKLSGPQRPGLQLLSAHPHTDFHCVIVGK